MTDQLAHQLGPLDWRIGIVDKSGRPTPEFQRRWNTQIGNNTLIGSIQTGSGPPTGVPTEGQAYIDISATPWTLYAGHDGFWETIGIFKFTDLSDVPHSYSGANNEMVQVDSGGTALIFKALTLRLYGGFPGKPDAGAVLFEIDMYGDEIFPVDLVGSRLGFDVNNTLLATLPIKVNTVTVGTAVIGAGGSSVTYTLAGGYTAASGDKLAFYAPTPQDATLSGLTYTWLGNRSNT